MAKRTTRGWWSGGTEEDPYETQYGSLADYLGYLSDLGEGKVGWGHSKLSKKLRDELNQLEDGPDVTTQSLTGEDPDDPSSGAFKHGGRIKKKKRKKKGKPRGVGKALHGYGKAMKHGK